MVCIRCQKRPAIIFIQRMDNGQMKQEGYCLHCARELHIKPVDDLMKQFGMSDQDLDNMENRMESMMEEMGDANPLSMMMNMANGGEDADPDSMDEDLIPGSNATFPLGFTSSEKKAAGCYGGLRTLAAFCQAPPSNAAARPFAASCPA